MDAILKPIVEENHIHTPDGQFIIPLPKKQDAKPLGEFRSQAVRRFLSFERSLHYSSLLWSEACLVIVLFLNLPEVAEYLAPLMNEVQV